MAQLICTLEEFYNFIGPRIRNDVATITKKKKKELGLICEECKNKVRELDAAHKHGRSRKEIIKMVLVECGSIDKRYIIYDLEKIIKKIREQHFPLEDNFRFLCKTCHKQYDDQIKQQEIDNTQKTELSDTYHRQDFSNEYQREFDLILSQNTNLRECLREIFLRFPDTEISTTKLREIYKRKYPNANSQKVPDYVWNLANYDNFLTSTSIRSLYKLARKDNVQKTESSTGIDDKVEEILCEDEAQSWEYKMGWTSMDNRKNILELIARIESCYDCYPVKRKSWYYYHRKDNGRQFSGIICHKNSSEIRFRIEPNSFEMNDPRIVSNRWFFPEGKEKSIKIIPENFDLIMKCLRHSFGI